MMSFDFNNLTGLLVTNASFRSNVNTGDVCSIELAMIDPKSGQMHKVTIGTFLNSLQLMKDGQDVVSAVVPASSRDGAHRSEHQELMVIESKSGALNPMDEAVYSSITRLETCNGFEQSSTPVAVKQSLVVSYSRPIVAHSDENRLENSKVQKLPAIRLKRIISPEETFDGVRKRARYSAADAVESALLVVKAVNKRAFVEPVQINRESAHNDKRLRILPMAKT